MSFMYGVAKRILPVYLALVIPTLVQANEVPANLLDFSAWKVTLPVDDLKPLGSPDEIKQPALETFVDARYLFLTKDQKGVVFRAHCGGATTKNSKYPRCELREMTSDGRSRAAWDTSADIIRTMIVKAAIIKTPPVKKHVVCAQIHDAGDDLMMIRLEGKKLFIERNKIGDIMLDDDYQLGTPFTVKIQAGKGAVKVWYQDALKMDWEVAAKGCYFKAGCYTQSNTDKGDKPESYGEVIIYQLDLLSSEK